MPSSAPDCQSVPAFASSGQTIAPLTLGNGLSIPGPDCYSALQSIRTYAIFILDSRGAILTWNPGVRTLLGYSEEEFRGMSLGHLLCPEERPLAAAHLDQAARSDGFAHEGYFVRKDGSRLCAASTLTPIRQNSVLTGFCQVLRDCSELQNLRAARENAERGVMERTLELSKVIDLLEHELFERERLESAVIDAAESERSRLGQDLHDSVCQQLAGIALMAKLLATRLSRQSASESAQAQKIVDLLRAATDQARGLARGLHPVCLDTTRGLVAGLQEMVNKVVSGARCTLKAPSRVDLPQSIALHLYRIAQESLQNALKHANAHEILIELRIHAGQLVLSISDDGRGLPDGYTESSDGMGLLNLRFRARAIGAQLQVESAPGQGTTVRCSLPWQAPPDPAADPVQPTGNQLQLL